MWTTKELLYVYFFNTDDGNSKQDIVFILFNIALCNILYVICRYKMHMAGRRFYSIVLAVVEVVIAW